MTLFIAAKWLWLMSRYALSAVIAFILVSAFVTVLIIWGLFIIFRSNESLADMLHKEGNE